MDLRRPSSAGILIRNIDGIRNAIQPVESHNSTSLFLAIYSSAFSLRFLVYLGSPSVLLVHTVPSFLLPRCQAVSRQCITSLVRPYSRYARNDGYNIWGRLFAMFCPMHGLVARRAFPLPSARAPLTLMSGALPKVGFQISCACRKVDTYFVTDFHVFIGGVYCLLESNRALRRLTWARGQGESPLVPGERGQERGGRFFLAHSHNLAPPVLYGFTLPSTSARCCYSEFVQSRPATAGRFFLPATYRVCVPGA
ncbi:hypothetical protein A0H81_00114 [Grifola frondosa]|uniref:Uncharacterized protein n=1 Tax=Grifola frondosa TaxID=5627 RepID=A0A1C7MQA7_GRIFR|nr:hypothetical protein A0H81_00114 [Grifola frondosa]